jgi:lipopolysaccharide export system ATP-binding protein
MSVLLRADSIGKSYPGRRILSSAYFEAASGSVTALVGRNGAGKSTLLRIAAGWLAADHGMVEFRGRRHHRPDPGALARDGMFFLPVERSILSPSFTLAQHLDAVEARFGPAPDRAALLKRLGIAACERVPTAALSGGERRRAQLAVALLRRAACLLADEPFRGIDPKDAEVVHAELRAAANAGCAVVVTGHEVAQLLALADAVTWVRDGSTQLLGSPAAAAADWRFRRDYLGAKD